MSFNHFSKFVKDHGQEQHLEVTFDWNEVDQKKKPWIVIDYNNFVFAVLDYIKGGHVALIEERVELIWKSLVACGARVCIINDGKTHSDERAVKKLQRMHADVLESTKGKISFLTSELVPSLIYSVAERVLSEQYPGSNVDNIEDDKTETAYIFCVANGEADPLIRAFCQKKILLGNDVYVFSADNCMLPGIFPTATAHLYSVDLKSLSVVQAVGKDITVLRGTAYNVLTMLHHLGSKTNEVLGTTGGAMTGEMFAYVCALLYGETAEFRHYEYDQPTPLVSYVKAYLCGEKKYDENYVVVLLYVTSALVRAWFKSPGRSTGDFAHCVAAIREHAMSVNNRSPAGNIFGLSCFFDSSAAMQKYARKLLFISELVKDSQSVYSGNKIIARSALASRRLAVSVDYGGLGVMYDAMPTGSGYVAYSSANNVRDGCPVRMANEQVAQEVSKEIMHRRNALAGLERPLLNNRRTLWGTWSDIENLDLSTEQLLSPLLSLVKQIEYMCGRMPAGQRAPSVNSVTDARSFNAYLSAIVERSTKRSQGHSEEGKEFDNRGEEDDDTLGAISLITSIVRLDAASHHHSDIFTCRDLYNKYPRRNRCLPLSGVIVSAVGDAVGMRFQTPPADPIMCSEDDSRYENSAFGTLFCLRNRANYLQQLVYPPAPAPTRSEGQGQVVEELTPREKAASVMFRSLDIRRAAGDAACSAISACWLSLPCATQAQRTHLVTQVTMHCTALYYCTALHCVTALHCITLFLSLSLSLFLPPSLLVSPSPISPSLYVICNTYTYMCHSLSLIPSLYLSLMFPYLSLAYLLCAFRTPPKTPLKCSSPPSTCTTASSPSSPKASRESPQL